MFDFFIPTRVHFGRGKLDLLGTTKLPGKKALIVIGGSSIKTLGYLERVCTLLKQNDTAYAIYDGITPNPTLVQVREGVLLARAEGCDFVIGLGGGSSIDAAKAMAVMVNNPGDYWDYIQDGTGKGLPLPNSALPIVAITTTAGTGTEADPWTVVTNEDTNEKVGFGCDQTFPTLSIVDPDLMMSVPPHLTAYQGFDALFHATEGYIANIATPISDMFALKSIELLGKYLPLAVKDGQNAHAREQVALANTISGMVESTSSCTSEHAMEHALSALHPQLPHGAGLIMLSLAYYTHFAPLVPDRLIDMAKALGVKDASDPMDFVTALAKLQADCGVDTLKMSDYGITSDMRPYMRNARDVLPGMFELDPVMLSEDETLAIFEKSFR